MKILLCSHRFYPDIGGIETASAIFAEHLVKAGATVTLVTDSPSPEGESKQFPYAIVRRPGVLSLFRLGRQHDIVFQNNISLQTLITLLFCGKPVVVTTQTWLARANGKLSWQDRLKLFALRFVHRVAISHAVADILPRPSTIIFNPFEDALFSPYRSQPKIKDIVFMGRLVSDKGCDLALRALSILRKEGLAPSFTVIGSGVERAALESLAIELRIADQVTFLGGLVAERAQEIAKHKIMVVPSLWAEPFGIVALEGIATGCALIASSQGGLPDAVGPCGLLFPNGDVNALAAALRKVLTDEKCLAELTAPGVSFLQGFTPTQITKEYLTLFEGLLRK